ncbi:MAG: cytochrome c biogenesis protein CcdA, partial [Desulfobacterales bacterium]
IIQPSSLAQKDPTAEKPVSVETAWSVDRARPGEEVTLAIVLKIQKGFHINADQRQVKLFEDFKPFPTNVQVVDASEGVTIESARFPQAKPIKADYSNQALMSFKDRTIIYLPMKLDQQLQPGSIELEIKVEYQACSDRFCLLPTKQLLKDTLAVVEAGSATSKINRELFADLSIAGPVSPAGAVDFGLFGWEFSINGSSGFGWLLVLIAAAFGGMLLNFTPCVLPLIPVKIISLSHVAEDRKKCFLLGLSMSLGVLAFWTVLGILIAWVSDFTAANQLFQYPAFTILVGIIIGIMAIGMFGFFSVHLPRFVYMINPRQERLEGSFALGILAAVMSTPCTAPFMGAAAAWAATQAPLTTLSTFAAIGGGMALPYLILSSFPTLVNRMPKTGQASELIKQVMGIFMLAAAAYFLGIGISALVSLPPQPPSRIYWWPVMSLVAVGGIWLAYRSLRLASKKITQIVCVGLGIILIVSPIWGALRLSADGPIHWIYYTPQRLEDAFKQGKIVVMDFTAEWCLNCKALEEGVLRDQKITHLLASKNIVPMKVDITGNNPQAKAKLKEIGSLTVPLLVIFTPDGQPVFKSDFYTVDQVLRAIKAVTKGHQSI